PRRFGEPPVDQQVPLVGGDEDGPQPSRSHPVGVTEDPQRFVRRVPLRAGGAVRRRRSLRRERGGAARLRAGCDGRNPDGEQRESDEKAHGRASNVGAWRGMSRRVGGPAKAAPGLPVYAGRASEGTPRQPSGRVDSRTTSSAARCTFSKVGSARLPICRISISAARRPISYLGTRTVV